MWPAWWLVPLGFVVGAYGTLIGAGGGFVLAPILALLYPADSPELLTSISLAVVFFNALSGSAAYARMGRIDYRSGSVFAIATIPGAVLGALTTSFLSRGLFDGILGALLVVGSVALLLGGDGEAGSDRRGAGRMPRRGHSSRQMGPVTSTRTTWGSE